VFGVFEKLTPIDPQDKKLVRLLEQIRDRLEVSKAIWAEYLALTPVQYENVVDCKAPLSAVSLFHLSERLRLNPSAFETGKIDFEALLESERGNKLFLSPRYTLAAHSKKHTAVNALNFITKYRGAYLRNRVNRHFQIHDDFWEDDNFDGQINIRFLTELWDFLKSQHFKNEDFQAIGFHSSVTLQNSPIARALSSMQTIESAFECMFGEFMQNFERNCSYKITRLKGNQCIVESRSISEVADALNVRHIGSPEGCQVRIGVFGAVPIYLGMPAAHGHETHCVHRGDSFCRFVFDFSSGQHVGSGYRKLTLLS
jgi:hypothetical protein